MMTSPKVKLRSVALVAEPAHVAHATVAAKSPPPLGIIGSSTTFHVMSARTAVVKVLRDEPSLAASVSATAAPAGEAAGTEP